ncbi:MAG TPA: DUF6119 family protein [Pseudogracilibacillus sp.]|nr:DUF6119 family protein [Pseudogracilibacillus sp.]
MIVPYYDIYDELYLEIDGELYLYESEEDIITILLDNISLSDDSADLVDTIQEIKLIAKYEGETISNNGLFKQIDALVKVDSGIYWLLDGNWLSLETDFIKTLNQLFREKVVENNDHYIKFDSLHPWILNKNEGDYNFQHNDEENVYVLDKILYQNIEICDLLVEDKQNNKLYFVHVKDSLDGNMRILAAQIEHALHFLDIAQNDSYILSGYYENITNRIGNISKQGLETKSSRAARKFIDRFPIKEAFIETVQHADKEFICAYRPKKNNDLNNPESLESTAAKLSMIYLTDVSENYDIPIKFTQIKTNN